MLPGCQECEQSNQVKDPPNMPQLFTAGSSLLARQYLLFHGWYAAKVQTMAPDSGTTFKTTRTDPYLDCRLLFSTRNGSKKFTFYTLPVLFYSFDGREREMLLTEYGFLVARTAPGSFDSIGFHVQGPFLHGRQIPFFFSSQNGKDSFACLDHSRKYIHGTGFIC